MYLDGGRYVPNPHSTSLWAEAGGLRHGLYLESKLWLTILKPSTA